MAELVMRGNRSTCRPRFPARPDELLLLRKPFAHFLGCRKVHLQHARDRPRGKALPSYTRALDHALLLLAQLIHLNFDHLLERLWDAQLDAFEGSRHPGAPRLTIQKTFLHQIRD